MTPRLAYLAIGCWLTVVWLWIGAAVYAAWDGRVEHAVLYAVGGVVTMAAPVAVYMTRGRV